MKTLFVYFFCFIILFSYASFYVKSDSGYTIENDKVVWENQFAGLEIYPHTANNIITQIQYCNLTWKKPDTDIDIAFKFDFPLSNTGIWLWKNISHNVKVYDYDDVEHNYTINNIESYVLISEPDFVDYGNIPSNYYAEITLLNSNLIIIGFDSYEWINQSISAKFYYHLYEIVDFHYEQIYWFDWKNIKDKFNHEVHNDKHYYFIKNLSVVQGKTYHVKWQYDIPIHTSGKWELLAKYSSDSLQYALDNDRYIKIDPWWSSQWKRYRVIYIDSSLIDTNLVDFPILVNITDSIADECDDGNSIRFIGTDNTTEYHYEIENWTDGQDRMVWVNVTYIYADQDTPILMYYNNSAASDSQNVEAVWNANYSAVWHFNNTLLDSTNNDVDLTNSGAAYSDSGRIGGCYDFVEGDHDYMTHTTFLDSMSNDFTFELWANHNALLSGYATYISKSNINGQDRLFFRNTDVDNLQLYAEGSNDGGKSVTSSVNIRASTWIYQVALFDDGNEMQVWDNLTEDTGVGTVATIQDGTHEDFFIGVHHGPSQNFLMDGRLDEIRISKIKRNDSWLKASFYTTNTSAGFLSWSDEYIFPNTAPNTPTNDHFSPHFGAGTYIYLIWYHHDEMASNIANIYNLGFAYALYYKSNLSLSWSTYLVGISGDVNIPFGTYLCIQPDTIKNTYINTNTSIDVYVVDTDGDSMTVSFYWINNTLIHQSTGVTSGNVARTGELSLYRNTTYYYYILINDGIDTTNISGNFTTLWNPPRGIMTIEIIYPLNETTDIKIQPSLYVRISHNQDDYMNISWYFGNTISDTSYLLNNTLNVYNGTYSTHCYPAYNLSHDYFWRFQLSNGTTWMNETFKFTTEGIITAGGGGRPSYLGLIIVAIGMSMLGIIGFFIVMMKKEEDEEEEY